MGHRSSTSFPEQAKQADEFPPHLQQQVRDQLDRLVESSHFRNSRRYPALLRFIVEETLAGRGDSLKERTLGIEVFGRAPDYDTNADPVVRVSAGEIRKRLAQYYQVPQHEAELHVDLPLGSYAPHFLPASHRSEPRHPAIHLEDHSPSGVAPATTPLPPTASTPVQSGRHHRLRKPLLWLGLLTALIASALLLAALRRHSPPPTAIALFWRPLLESKDPALIVIGVHTFDEHGQDLSPSSDRTSPLLKGQSMLDSMTRSDMVSVSDLYAYSAVVNLLAQHAHPFRTQSSSETTLEQLRRGPVVLVGGFNNIWTMRLTSKLRYHFIAESPTLHAIQDSEHPETLWTFDSEQNALNNSRDYAIAGCVFDPQLEQYVIFGAGIGKSGTEAAAEFLSSNSHLASWQSQLRDARHTDAEVVLSSEIIEGKSGPPKVIASIEW